MTLYFDNPTNTAWLRQSRGDVALFDNPITNRLLRPENSDKLSSPWFLGFRYQTKHFQSLLFFAAHAGQFKLREGVVGFRPAPRS